MVRHEIETTHILLKTTASKELTKQHDKTNNLKPHHGSERRIFPIRFDVIIYYLTHRIVSFLFFSFFLIFSLIHPFFHVLLLFLFFLRFLYWRHFEIRIRHRNVKNINCIPIIYIVRTHGCIHPMKFQMEI